jgi:hypothetical protein
MLQQQRHTDMDSHQAILPDALRVNENLFQTDLCRNPVSMDVMFTSLHWHLGSGNPCLNDEPFTLHEASC